MSNGSSSHAHHTVLSASPAAGAASLRSSQASAAADPAAIRPFSFKASDEALADLRRRVAATKWPDRETVNDASEGVQLTMIQKVARYWATDYDWRKAEAKLNALPQFITEIDGLDIHFIHVRSKHENALPLIVTHGWPGTFIEQLKIIDPLTNPTAHGGSASDAFDVVIPSMPGYGFSARPTATGWDPTRIARAWTVLMKRLGYDRYVAQGGDWGYMVTTQLAVADPEHCAGIHVNMAPPIPATEDITPEEQEYLDGITAYNDADSGYFKEQSTKPQTIGYALDDSPVGLAAWIVEKFRTWSDCDGDVERSFSKDQLLDNLMVYWATATAHSAGRLYYEFDKGLRDGTLDLFTRPTQPVGYTRYPKEIMRTSRRWFEAQYDLGHFAEMPRGGHFAAFECPDLYVPDIRECFRALR